LPKEFNKRRRIRKTSVVSTQQHQSREGSRERLVRVNVRSTPIPAPVAPRSSLGRILRIIVGLGLIGLPSWFLIPSHWKVTSTQGVVNGHTIIITAPIDGIVTVAPPAVMQSVSAGSPLVRIEASVVDRRRIEELETEAATLTERVAALKDRIRAMDSLKGELEASYTGYQKSMAQRVAHELEEARLAARAASASSAQRAREEQQEQTLFGRGYSSMREFSQATSGAEIARAQAAGASTTVARLAGQLESIKGGIFTGPGDSRNDVPYSRQRIHEMAMQQLHDESEIREQNVRIAQLKQQIHAETERVKRRSSYQLDAPVDAIIWHRSVTVGSPVGLHAELLQLVDRSSLFVDATIRARFIGDIQPGDPVVVRAVGSSAEIGGRVRYIMGESALDRSAAVNVAPSEPHEAHVIIDFRRDSKAGGEGAGHLQALPVGKRVDVDFPKARHLPF
jgi:multidrug resistance efflux pump